MAKKRREREISHFSEKNILPNFELANRFCYFVDLIEGLHLDPGYLPKPMPPTGTLIERKQKLYAAAKNGISDVLEQPLAMGRNSDETIRTAIEFLQHVAENERSKEIQVVEQYMTDLQNNPLIANLLKNNNYPDIKELIKFLHDFSNDPTRVDMKDFYVKLTTCINAVKKAVDDYKNRVNQLLDKNRKAVNATVNGKVDKQAAFGLIAADQAAFASGSIIDGLFNSMIGIKSRAKIDSFSQNIQNVISDYIINQINNNADKIKSIYIPSFLTGITMEFMKFLETNLLQGRIQGTNGEVAQIFRDIVNLPGDLLNKWFEKYIQSDSHFISGYKNFTDTFLYELDTLKYQMGFRQLTGEEKKGREEKITKRMGKQGARNRNAFNMLQTEGTKELYNKVFKNLGWIHFEVKKGRAGTLDEAFNIVQGAMDIKGHAATDSISINMGTLIGDIDLDLDYEIRQALLPMIKKIEEFEKIQRKDRFDSLQQSFEDMNEQVHNDLKKLDEQLNELSKYDKKLFIYHESLKLYLQQEEGLVDQFHGRELQAISALDRLYSLNGTMGLTMPEQEVLYNLIINIPSNAVGGPLKHSLENYLGIFAGMLMFDDMQNMAKEAAKKATDNIQYSNLENIHVYRLNELYVPGSYLLTSIATAFEQGYRQLTLNQDAAVVRLNTGEAEGIIDDYNEANIYGSHFYSIEDWPPMANLVARSVTMEISFFKGFLNFVQDLQNAIS